MVTRRDFLSTTAACAITPAIIPNLFTPMQKRKFTFNFAQNPDIQGKIFACMPGFVIALAELKLIFDPADTPTYVDIIPTFYCNTCRARLDFHRYLLIKEDNAFLLKVARNDDSFGVCFSCKNYITLDNYHGLAMRIAGPAFKRLMDESFFHMCAPNASNIFDTLEALSN